MARPERVDEPIELVDALDRMIRSLKGTDRRQLSGVFGRWNEALGDDLARHVRPLKLEGRNLTVEVVDPAWATQVKFLAADIIDRLRTVVGVEIDQIDVRVQRTGRR